MTLDLPLPHYLRFARALALVGTLGAATEGCCPLVPDSFACSHCTCSWQPSTASQPIACDTIHREAVCCPSLAAPGPLPPPDLA